MRSLLPIGVRERFQRMESRPPGSTTRFPHATHWLPSAPYPRTPVATVWEAASLWQCLTAIASTSLVTERTCSPMPNS